MVKIVGIQFKEVGKIYWFNPGSLELAVNDLVVVETVRGLELGQVITEIETVEKSSLEYDLKDVIRIAKRQDLLQFEDNFKRAQYDIKRCKEIVAEYGLPMKLLSCEYTLDAKKLIIYYNADGRVDFRELLKGLANEFRVRIELRQVGSREGAKFIGDVGSCGREVCCGSHLREFNLVTMRMAKEQGMALNASKVAGLCGKLMCCIAFENPLYKEIRKRMPSVGDIIATPNCEECRVINVNYVSKQVTVAHEEQNQVWSHEDIKGIKIKQEQIEDPHDLTDDVIDD